MHPGIQTDLDAGVPTLTTALRVQCRDGSVFGFTATNIPLQFDDGSGPVTYEARTGVSTTDVETSADMSVDNAEATTLIARYEPPVTTDEIQAGKFDGATYRLYLLNYESLSPGRCQLLQSGPIGRVKTRDGLSAVLELRSLTAQLRERSVCEKWSLTCRARFGSQPGEERFPCGFDAESLWQPAVVSEQGAETDRTFVTASALDFPVAPVPGLFRFTTGRNAGQAIEIESFEAVAGGYQITLAYGAPFAIEPGDEGEIRQDCNKHARDAERGCLAHWGADWPLHFRGEPDIPVSDSKQSGTPGAAVNSADMLRTISG